MVNPAATRCWVCGKSDHTTQNCSAAERLCFNCQQPGHQLVNCPLPRGILNRKCGGCGQKGHLAANCPKHSEWICKNCRQQGHEHWECTKPKGYPRMKCRLCEEIGHLQNECNNRTKWKCTNCHGSGHHQWECSKPRGYLRMTCSLCQEVGHLANECVNRSKWHCMNCGENGHSQQECPKPRGYLRMICKFCEETGHIGTECINYSKWRCVNCNDVGHLHMECPKPWGHSKRQCRQCGEKGHLSSGCPNRRCFRCGGTGHISKTCPNLTNSQGHCFACFSTAHVSRNCPLVNGGSSPDELNNNSPLNEPNNNNGYFANPKPKADSAFDNGKRASESPKGARQDMDAMKYWRLGLVAVALEEYIDAISLLTEAISIDSTKVIFFVTRGTTYAKNKDYAAGIGDFQLASTMRGYSQTAEILVQIARCRLHLGSPSMALLALRDALSLEPSDTDALTLRRRVLDLNTHMEGYRGARTRKHWHTARSSYELCLQVYAEEDSDPPVEIQCWDIELSIVKGSWDAAIAAVDHLLLEKPKEIQAMTLRALVLLLTGRLLQGLDQINAVLRFDPDNQPAKELRSRIKGVIRLKEDGNALFGEKQWNAAIGKWSDALELVNDKEEEGKGGRMRAILLLNRAIARSKLGQFSEGLSDINGTLGLDPSYFKAFLVRGRIYVGLELYESAAQDFKVALEHSVSLEPADVRALKDELDKAEEMVARERNQVKDYYKILGLSRNCTAAELRKAYHKQSLKHHPDKGGLEEKFKLVNEAYAILSDETARRDYDEKKEKNED